VERHKARGQGGPFIPFDAVSEESGPLQESLFKLNAKVDRLQDLQGLLTKLPLNAPLSKFSFTSGFGVRKDPFTGDYAQHLGVDLAGPYKASVVSPGEGTVVHAGFDGSYGRMVEIDHGMGLVSRYAHLFKVEVKKGDTVARGTVLGVQGCTGRCMGSHVHFEVLYNGKHINPLKFLKAGNDVFKG
ncbi:MAG: M23 family metallopeptidase, partial [Rhodospirillaceae bacterium]